MHLVAMAEAISGPHQGVFDALVQGFRLFLEELGEGLGQQGIDRRRLAWPGRRHSEAGTLDEDQVRGIDQALRLEQQRMLQGIFQLADVAGPGVLQQASLRRGREGNRVLGVGVQEMPGQRQDIALPLA